MRNSIAFFIFLCSVFGSNNVSAAHYIYGTSNHDLWHTFYIKAIGVGGFLVLSSIIIWMLSRLLYALEKLFNSALQKKAKNIINENTVKKSKINLKKLLTVLILYEIIIIFILFDDSGICESIFFLFDDFCSYEGFQYIVMCIFVPVLLSLILSWRQEIMIFFKRLWYMITH